MATIEEITKRIEEDPANAAFEAEGQKPLFQAPPTARINVVGQAPGAKAEEAGIVWGDESGDRLRAWLGVDRATFYDSGMFALLPMDFYFPGRSSHGDLAPRKDFADKWFPQILDTMPDIQLTVLAGSSAIHHFLDLKSKDTITDVVEHYEEYLPQYFPIIHPSGRNNIWIAEHPWFDAKVIPALQARVREILA